MFALTPRVPQSIEYMVWYSSTCQSCCPSLLPARPWHSDPPSGVDRRAYKPLASRRGRHYSVGAPLDLTPHPSALPLSTGSSTRSGWRFRKVSSRNFISQAHLLVVREIRKLLLIRLCSPTVRTVNFNNSKLCL